MQQAVNVLCTSPGGDEGLGRGKCFYWIPLSGPKDDDTVKVPDTEFLQRPLIFRSEYPVKTKALVGVAAVVMRLVYAQPDLTPFVQCPCFLWEVKIQVSVRFERLIQEFPNCAVRCRIHARAMM